MARYEYNVTTGETIELPDLPAIPDIVQSQFSLDESRYNKRGAVKDSLIAFMAADNMSRVRSGLWTVNDLKSLMADAEVKSVLDFVNTLSFEMAIQQIGSIANPLITTEIKAVWVAKMAEHLYLVP